MKKIICSFGLLVILPGLIVSARSQTFSESQLTQLTQQGREAYHTLLVAEEFEDKTVGYGAEPSKLVAAYNVLLKESAGNFAFRNLLDKGTLAGQLYALCGLYFKDRVFFNLVIEKYKHSQQEIHTVKGCIGWTRPVADLMEAHKPIVIDPNRPKESLSEHFELNKKMVTEWDERWKKFGDGRPPDVYELDISNGGYSVWFLK